MNAAILSYGPQSAGRTTDEGMTKKNTKDGEGNGRIGSCFANHTVEKKEEEEHADNRDDNGHGNRGAGLYHSRE